ncbi:MULTISPECIES: sulfur carrier protein ThiS [Romboutsia]|uniref:Molybdopterin synthase/thiamin biosynthesis sulphur carrier, beta-grasp n=1 Tax=Romboutsia hominis TaxID=1507512 RepID=A0A2P2BNA0_9FIRM|nr:MULTISPECIES: sulfur carrier protein ThiS [Romboutsia]MCH1958467.1 sulfur carrier protein ThiS [Romboutsia hominis]MCH1970381.1 sulfur carrier protein ThiS [Romboutsia hominis]MDB8790029.1 sulfur carrier protein ThiS [Romboutsia sp. 1001216sp1]MDB8802349.1 sulfur carrier protein ThiS [Romboutsia sp. 1001216sp1]MDB8805198.1 sulfur carrier protein ThiS [Romboutsia sp. 1001216sp1]
MKVNGEEFEFKSDMTISKLLEDIGVKKDSVVVEINLNIIENNQYDSYILREEDVIEVIRFVGGG